MILTKAHRMPQNVTELKDVTQEKSQDGYTEVMPLILQ